MSSGKRGANGESTINQDADGRWHGYVGLGQKEGGKRGPQACQRQ